MKRIELARVGRPSPPTELKWEDLKPEAPWAEVIRILAPGTTPSDIQAKAIRDGGLLNSRRNLVIGAPTNSGKSLLAYLAMLQTALKGQRALLLEPLRAIAQEKYDELRELSAKLAGPLGRQVDVCITTGDYRLNEETLQAPPPENGELVIATPERIEAILRQPESEAWLESVGIIVVDEAHMLGDRMRGASLEYVVTAFRCLPAPPRIILMSATIGQPDNLQKWLEPADAVTSDIRSPELIRSLCLLEEGEDGKAALHEMVREILLTPEFSVLIFVYQTAWTGTLARELTSLLAGEPGSPEVLSYHSRLSSATRADVRAKFLSNECRCVVTTAALAMGVNLPATHVIVRDTTTGPGDPLPVGTMIQMMGRAGRGTTAGHATVFLKGNRPQSVDQLQKELEELHVPELRSAWLTPGQSQKGANEEPPLAETVLSLLARKSEEGLSSGEVEAFIGKTMNGSEVVHQCLPALRWLSGSSRLLAFEMEGKWKATRLGQAAIRGSLPLHVACGTAGLVRDLLSVDGEDKFLLRWSKLDLLLLIELMASRPMLRKPFSEKAAGFIDDFVSRNETKSVIFQEWIRGAAQHSKAAEILGSLGIEAAGKSGAEASRKAGYSAMQRAVVLWQRAQGTLCADIQRRWDLKDLEEIQEQWRDDRLFHLTAMLSIWDIRCFFFHLKEECGANDERILRVKRGLQRIKSMSFQLMDELSWCSPLGSIFCRLRRSTGKRTGGSPAKGTMARLEDAGIRTPQELKGLSVADFQNLGVRPDLAAQIRAFMR